METATAFRSGLIICNKSTKASLGGSDFVRVGSQLRMSPSGIKVLWSSVFRTHLLYFSFNSDVILSFETCFPPISPLNEPENDATNKTLVLPKMKQL